VIAGSRTPSLWATSTRDYRYTTTTVGVRGVAPPSSGCKPDALLLSYTPLVLAMGIEPTLDLIKSQAQGHRLLHQQSPRSENRTQFLDLIRIAASTVCPNEDWWLRSESNRPVEFFGLALIRLSYTAVVRAAGLEPAWTVLPFQHFIRMRGYARYRASDRNRTRVV
jgi:hypothetical protein